ncbi:hypothetical protein [Flavobacterium sp.]|uniref:hypothetical protein n=1 Tax=Flavobacterium sp. TaxID=239 RepID=UPI00375171C9
MFEQLTQLVNQFGNDAVVNNPAVPNEQNEAVMGEASNSIIDSLKNMAASGNMEGLGKLFQGDNASDTSNPAVQEITNNLTNSLGEKFGLSGDAASGVAGSLIPKVLGSLIGGAKDPNKPGFNVSDIIGAISGGSGNSGGIMDAVSKYGGQFGLDQNADGKVDMSDAMAAVSGKTGGMFGGLLGKLFGK